MTFQEWRNLAQKTAEMVRRIQDMQDKEIRCTARAAGIDPNIYPIHAHNAMCSFESGKPWPEVDYSLLRRVLWLEQRMWEPSRLRDSILARAWKGVR